MLVQFPQFLPELAFTAHRYYRTHFVFILNILKAAGCSIQYFRPDVTPCANRAHCFAWIDNRPVLFDISDYCELLLEEAESFDLGFKLHCRSQPGATEGKIAPFSPVSFYDWPQYEELCREINYRAKGRILNTQRAHTQNFERRSYVRRLLEETYGDEVDLSISPQIEFWKKISGCLVSVCVPGARIDILDRGQLQYMAFGACTISPRLSIDLPYGEQLVPGTHYLECRSNWDDLIEVIEWARRHREECVEIGQNAMRLFNRALQAKALFEWVLICLRRLEANPNAPQA